MSDWKNDPHWQTAMDICNEINPGIFMAEGKSGVSLVRLIANALKETAEYHFKKANVSGSDTNIVRIDDKWSVEFDPNFNDKPCWWLRHGERHSRFEESNATVAMFYALLEVRNNPSQTYTENQQISAGA